MCVAVMRMASMSWASDGGHVTGVLPVKYVVPLRRANQLACLVVGHHTMPLNEYEVLYSGWAGEQ